LTATAGRGATRPCKCAAKSSNSTLVRGAGKKATPKVKAGSTAAKLTLDASTLYGIESRVYEFVKSEVYVDMRSVLRL
jgi:hypothetical protein